MIRFLRKIAKESKFVLFLLLLSCAGNFLYVNPAFTQAERSHKKSLKKAPSIQTSDLGYQQTSIYKPKTLHHKAKYPFLKSFLAGENIVEPISKINDKNIYFINKRIQSLLFDLKHSKNPLLEQLHGSNIGYCPSINSPNTIPLNEFNQRLELVLKDLYSVPNTQLLTHDSRDAVWSPRLSSISHESYEESQLIRLVTSLRTSLSFVLGHEDGEYQGL